MKKYLLKILTEPSTMAGISAMAAAIGGSKYGGYLTSILTGIFGLAAIFLRETR